MVGSTAKLYYKDLFLSECDAVVVDVSEKGIVSDRTVAFPEGGGQEGDKGTIIIGDTEGETISVSFIDAQKGLGRVLSLNDFPTIQVDAPVYHVVDAGNIKYFKNGMKIHIKIDIERRAKITVNHTGIHLALMGIERLRPGISKFIRGAHIGDDDARLDFYVNERFSSSELEEVMRFANEVIDRDEPIQIYHHPEEPEAWYWKCMNAIYPCGGTHLPSSRYVGHIILKRKNLGKNLDRITATYPNAKLPLDLYHGI